MVGVGHLHWKVTVAANVCTRGNEAQYIEGGDRDRGATEVRRCHVSSAVSMRSELGRIGAKPFVAWAPEPLVRFVHASAIAWR